MWPFSKKWSAPAPRLAMVVSIAKQELPSIVMLANPSGAEGAVPGMAGPAENPMAETMMEPMDAGQYVAIGPEGGTCILRVEQAEPQSQGLSLAPEMLEPSGLTEEMLAKFNQPRWRVVLEMTAPGNEVRETVIFITRLAQRLASLGDGVVMDTSAYRFFGPAGWKVKEPQPEFDVLQHVHIHIEPDSGWFHTHGLIKFGRPELEVYDVPPELEAVALGTLLDIARYVMTSSIIEPGQTCGEPSQPFFAREGTKNRKEHWQGLPVLELVDIDERRRPVPSGAPKALRLFAAL